MEDTEYVTIKELMDTYGRSFYNRIIKSVKPIKHSDVNVKVFRKKDIEAYIEFYKNEPKTLSIKDMCKHVNISREWFYQLLRKGILPSPVKGKVRNSGYYPEDVEIVSNIIKKLGFTKEFYSITKEKAKELSIKKHG